MSAIVAEVKIHPLVIASTCDHFVRVSSGGSKLPSSAPVYGLLFGTKEASPPDNNNETSATSDGDATSGSGDASEAVVYVINDSVDLVYNLTGDGTEVDVIEGEVERKVRLWTAVFSSYQLIGWYTFGDEPTAQHLRFHNYLRSFTAAAGIEPVLLLLNQHADAETEDLPISVHISESIGEDQTNLIFVNVSFQIETSDAEKIALDHITSTTPIAGFSQLELQNQSVATSLRILDGKVETMIQTLEGMQSGKIPPDYELLRQASRICQSLPPIDTEDFHKQCFDDDLETKLISYLSAVTTTASQLNDVSEVYTSLYGDRMFTGSGV